MRIYYVYMLLCADRSFYIDITNDPEMRVAQHQLGQDRTCYTFTRRPVTLVHCSDFSNVEDAIAWEKQLKGWSRAKKVAFISNNWCLVHELAKRTRCRSPFDSGASRLRSGRRE
ncbi:MAG: GIY-YIG nuclease family protein [Candidatus Cybelea sp.]|jgi:putative endonuclease